MTLARQHRLEQRPCAELPNDLLPVLFEDTAIGLLLIDAKGCIVRPNATLRRLLEPRVDLSPGEPALAIFPQPDRERVRQALRPALDGAEGGRGQEGAKAPEVLARLEWADPDPERVVAVSAVALREPAGCVLLRLSDITRQRRLEARLAQSQRLHTVGSLAGGIAHDFNNLLNAIIGAADLVLERSVDPETREDVEQVRRAAERGAALVARLLAFKRGQALPPRVIAIDEAVEDLSHLLTRLLDVGVNLKRALHAPGRLVRMDPAQLDQVLLNLAVNARDAMPDGGTLTLRTGHVALNSPLVGEPVTVPPGRYVTVEVQDTGAGIPRDVMPRIFDPFFTTKQDGGGTGLGLSTVQEIVRGAEGFLTVETEVGAGTRIRLYLPSEQSGSAATPHETSDRRVSVASVAPADALTVLLVDDEAPMRRLAERALARRGWTVLAADCGEAALRLLAERRSARLPPPSVIVSDVAMPGIDGSVLVRTVRETYPGLPAILLSGYTEQALGLDLSPDEVAFLGKPYATKALVAEIERVVALPQQNISGTALPFGA